MWSLFRTFPSFGGHGSAHDCCPRISAACRESLGGMLSFKKHVGARTLPFQKSAVAVVDDEEAGGLECRTLSCTCEEGDRTANSCCLRVFFFGNV